MLWQVEGCYCFIADDDLALVVFGKTKESLEIKAEIAAARITLALGERIEIASKEIKLIILTGRRKLTSLTVNIKGINIKSHNSIKYKWAPIIHNLIRFFDMNNKDKIDKVRL